MKWTYLILKSPRSFFIDEMEKIAEHRQINQVNGPENGHGGLKIYEIFD